MRLGEASRVPITRVGGRAAREIPERWMPSFGSWPEGNGVRFRVWAPKAQSLELVIEGSESLSVPLERFQDGTFGTHLSYAYARAGTRYGYRIDGAGPIPDPASRYQPEGVHGPSEVVDPGRFVWTDQDWRGIAHEDLVLYEIHTGTFSPEGTFAGVADKLPYLVSLGVTAVELMPVANFPGNRNWGYDGVALFAPARCYGTPDDLRRLVDEAHRLGLAVLLDVVYNHIGPEGNYFPSYTPYLFSERHKTLWGNAINFDGVQSEFVRELFIENALHWIHEYHIDGLRLDATHAIYDDRPRHFIAELTGRVRESLHDRRVIIIAEDYRNLAFMVKSQGQGGWGLDGVWADDFHHKVRVSLAGDNEGYYRDYDGSMTGLAEVLNRGWLYTGQFSEHLQDYRGTDPRGLPPRRFVFCLQNHDQVGNRALGERLHHQIEISQYRAASVLMLCAPATPLLFMGQEWATTRPFLYFTDHPEPLGRMVTEGRRQEFRHFRKFSDPESRERIPDPQAETTFLASRLDWSEAECEPHSSVRRLYRALLTLRHHEPALLHSHLGGFQAHALTESTLLIRQDADDGPSLLVIIQMQGEAHVNLHRQPALDGLNATRCQLVLTTEDAPYTTDPIPPRISMSGPAPEIRFLRPSAVILRAWKRAEMGIRSPVEGISSDNSADSLPTVPPAHSQEQHGQNG